MINLFKKESYFDSGSFPLTVVIQDPQYICPAHRHQFYEIGIVLSGTATHIVEQTRYPLNERDVFVILDDTWHTFENMNHLALANILFDPNTFLVDSEIVGLPGFHSMFKPSEKHHSGFHNRLNLNEDAFVTIKHNLFKLKAELENQKEGFELMAKSIFLEIVVFLSRCYCNPSMRTSGALYRIANVIKYIEENYYEPITLETLEEISCMSRRNLTRLFREALDDSPIDYLIRIRIKSAMELLKNDGKTITEIAMEVGFSDSNYFTRQFHKITGMTPRSYQDNIKRA